MLHCTWVVCWIANSTRLFRSNCFPTDRVIANWNRCNHIHWPVYLLQWNVDQKRMFRSSPFTWQSSHKCEVVKSVFGFWKGESFKPSTYSTDLSPCDFFLFPRLKKMLSGNNCTSISSLGNVIYQCLQQIPKEAFLSAFRDWVKRLQKCVLVKGEYFEGL